MRILLQSRFYPSVGGIETLARVISENLCKLGHHVTVCSDVAENRDKLYSGPADVVYRPSGSVLLRLWRENDVVVHMMVGMKTVWPQYFSRTPSVFVHQSTYWIDRSGRRDWREKTKLLIARSNPWNICASRFIKESIALDQAEVVPNCYDNSLFRSTMDVARDRDVIFVGRLVSDKGADLLLDAIHRHRDGREWSVTIVGSGPDDVMLRDRAKSFGLDRVRFTGSLSPSLVAEELQRHRVMVVPSLWREPFGIVALEGIACGAVPIVSDGGGLPEAIGDAGITFERGNVAALAEAMGCLLRNRSLQNELRARASTHVSKFTAERMCELYLTVMEKAVADRC